MTGDGMEVPEYGIYADRDWPNPEKGFAAMITRMDGDVGRLLELLEELGIDEQTLVIFTSDNGPHHEGGHDHEYFDSNGPLRGHKRSMHDGGIRVPMIARWPGKIAPGSESALPSASWDFLPTACALAETEVPVPHDGNSYLPTLMGNPQQQAKHEYLYWASSEGETAVGVRCGDWKLVKYRQKKNDDRGAPSEAADDWRLYNLDQDINEANDVATENPSVVQEILGMLKRDELL